MKTLCLYVSNWLLILLLFSNNKFVKKQTLVFLFGFNVRSLNNKAEGTTFLIDSEPQVGSGTSGWNEQKVIFKPLHEETFCLTVIVYYFKRRFPVVGNV